jgi:hypothetical protein
MKKTAFISLVLILAASASAQNWFQGSLDQALAKAKAESKPVLIDFFSGG